MRTRFFAHYQVQTLSVESAFAAFLSCQLSDSVVIDLSTMPARTNQRKRAAEDEVAVAKAAAKRAAKVMQGVADASSASQLAINSTLQAYLCECDAKIKDFFKDSMDGPPTNFSGLPVYDPVAATQALSSGNKYTSSAPLFWINTSYELQPNVPKYRKPLESCGITSFPNLRPIQRPFWCLWPKGRFHINARVL